tara:strand:- start:191 stop:631 length:441 start_codon:yes stop_codon:yes gene_type:complete
VNSLFHQIGGMSEIKSLVNEFYDVMDSDPYTKELRDAHAKILNSARNNLYRFLTHWFGGPKIFNDKYINGQWLELRHRHVDLSDKFAQQWLYCMETAMDNLSFNKELQETVMSHQNTMILEMQGFRSNLEIHNRMTDFEPKVDFLK